MCTVTFYPISDNHYYLSMNRDEARTRSRARPPEPGTSGTVSYVRPIDGDKGGTWIGVNQHGLSLCIMNWHSVKQPIGDSNEFISRGWIIPNLMDSINLEDCDHQLKQLSLDKTKPFRLLGIQPSPLAAKEWSWDMHELHVRNLPVKQNIWTSSGWKPDHVHNTRKRVFDKFWHHHDLIDVGNIQTLHATQLPEPGPLAISMSHPKAMTVSNTIIELTPTETIMHYLDGFPAKSKDWYRINLKGRYAAKFTQGTVK
ncbi:MAG TPA: NRDE family protein [Balneolales bacterium]|nr:NRDE family protein [Balneolales bacterium]